MTGDQRLAMAVILQAVEDRTNLSIELSVRREAAQFLASQESVVWCAVAGLSPAAVRSVSITRSRRTFDA